jgi:hypothetical protein
MTEFTITPELEIRLAAAETVGEAVRLFREAGLPITEAHLNAMLKTVPPMGELTEEALDAVAGGAPACIRPVTRFEGKFFSILGPGGNPFPFRQLLPKLR